MGRSASLQANEQLIFKHVQSPAHFHQNKRRFPDNRTGGKRPRLFSNPHRNDKKDSAQIPRDLSSRKSVRCIWFGMDKCLFQNRWFISTNVFLLVRPRTVYSLSNILYLNTLIYKHNVSRFFRELTESDYLFCRSYFCSMFTATPHNLRLDINKSPDLSDDK